MRWSDLPRSNCKKDLDRDFHFSFISWLVLGVERRLDVNHHGKHIFGSNMSNHDKGQGVP